MHILFLVVLPAKLEYLGVKASNRHQKMLSDAAGSPMSQLFALSALQGTTDAKSGGGLASAHSQDFKDFLKDFISIPHVHLLSPYPSCGMGKKTERMRKLTGQDKGWEIPP